MNLHEDIDRIKEVMGVLNEDSRSNTIMNMINDIGLYNTIKMMGNYEDVLNYINYEDISDADKIKFIQEVVESKSPNMRRAGNISIHDMGIPPISYDSHSNTDREITSFGMNGVTINVYKNGKFADQQVVPYDFMSADSIDRSFKTMLKYS